MNFIDVSKNETEVASSKMHWFVIKTQLNKEKVVAEKLSHELRGTSLEKRVSNIVVPTTKEITSRNGKKYLREKIILSGYVFIQTDSVYEVNRLLYSINGSLGFVRTRSGEISPMKEKEINEILQTEKDSENMTLENIYSIGDSVSILTGAFTTFVGNISEISGDKVKVDVLIFGKKTPVHLTINDIKKV